MNSAGKKFLFISPPYESLKGFSCEDNHLGLLYVATVLDRAGFESKVYNADSLFMKSGKSFTIYNRAFAQQEYAQGLSDDAHPAWQELRRVLQEAQPDVIGVTVTTPAYSSSRKVMKIARELFPAALLLVGGPHVSILKERALESLPEADIGFVGEAENTILEFLDAYYSGKDLSLVKGIVYRKEHELCFTGHRERIRDLDSLPFPDRKLVVHEAKYSRKSLGTLITSRGCCFDCSFCAAVPLWGRDVILRSPENIIDEIDYLKRSFNVEYFFFFDDNFTIDKKRLVDFCHAVIKKYGKGRIEWGCLSNAQTLDQELLVLMKDAGCKRIEMGIESGSDRILALINKNIDIDKATKVAKLIKKTGIWLHAFFMAGFPFDTEKDIRATIRVIKSIRPDSLHLNTFTPYPGTKLFDYLVQKGLFNPFDDFSVYDGISNHSVGSFFVENMSQERYKVLLTELLELSKVIGQTARQHNVPLKMYHFVRRKINNWIYRSR